MKKFLSLLMLVLLLSCITHGTRQIGLTIEEKKNCTNVLAMQEKVMEIADFIILIEAVQEDQGDVVSRYLRREAKWYLYLYYQLEKSKMQKCKQT